MEKLLVLWQGKNLGMKILPLLREWKYFLYFESKNRLRMKILSVLWEWCCFSAVLPTGHCVPPAPQCANAKHEFQKMQSCKIVERLCNWWQQKYFSHDTFRKKINCTLEESSWMVFPLLRFNSFHSGQWCPMEPMTSAAVWSVKIRSCQKYESPL